MIFLLFTLLSKYQVKKINFVFIRFEIIRENIKSFKIKIIYLFYLYIIIHQISAYNSLCNDIKIH